MGVFASYRLLAAVAFIFITAACSNNVIIQNTPAPTSTLPNPEPVTITWAFWGDPWEVEINERVVQIFEADNPNINVETFHRPWNDYFKELRPKLNNGEAVPDVLFWSQAPIDTPYGGLMDLTPFMDAENYNLTDFYPGLLIHFKMGDKIYGLPRDSDTKVIFYNKRHFNRADVSFLPPDGLGMTCAQQPWLLKRLRWPTIALPMKSTIGG